MENKELIYEIVVRQIEETGVIPTYASIARETKVSSAVVKRILNDIPVYAQPEKMMPYAGKRKPTSIQKRKRERLVKVYTQLVKGLLKNGVYPLNCKIAKELGVSGKTIYRDVKELKSYGLLANAKSENKRCGGVSNSDIQKVYEAVLLIQTVNHYAASQRELIYATGLKTYKLQKALATLQSQGRITIEPKKHRAIQIVNTDPDSKELYVGSEELKKILYREYVTIVSAAMSDFEKLYDRQPTLVELTRITSLSEEAVRIALNKMRIGA